MNDVLKQVKHLKESAKTNRDFEDFDDALADLDKAIELLLDRSAEDSEYKMNLQRELADCYGMKGGIYRRLASKGDFEENLNKAIAAYHEGLTYEEKTNDDSYNRSNWIVTSILLNPDNLKDQQAEIQKGMAIVQEHVAGKRKDQWWAWADLGLFKLLSNDKDWPEAYRQFKRVGARAQDYKSTIFVLSNLWEQLQKAELPEAKAVSLSVGDAIHFLLINEP